MTPGPVSNPRCLGAKRRKYRYTNIHGVHVSGHTELRETNLHVADCNYDILCATYVQKDSYIDSNSNKAVIDKNIDFFLNETAPNFIFYRNCNI